MLDAFYVYQETLVYNAGHAIGRRLFGIPRQSVSPTRVYVAAPVDGVLVREDGWPSKIQGQRTFPTASHLIHFLLKSGEPNLE